jgi:transposase
MLIKTLLNRIEKVKFHVYHGIALEQVRGVDAIVVDIEPRKNSRPICPVCGKRCSIYDTQEMRLFEYVPLWGFQVFFRYSPRRSNCHVHGPLVERIPWANGKEQLTNTYKVFLARWAKRLSWKETADIFKTSWDSVLRAVKHVVEYGLAHRNMDGIEQIGVDEIKVFKKGDKFLTLVYQLDKHAKRLLWSGPRRRVKTLLRFFREFGKERSARLKYVCSDMWAPYLKVIRKKAPQAIHILDRFHIMKNINDAIDTVRREEAKRYKGTAQEDLLTNSRWVLLKKPDNLTDNQVIKLRDLLQSKLQSVKSYLMREDFQRFWQYRYVAWAEWFLDAWVKRAMYSKIEPMKKVARSLRSHKELILNWFRASGEVSTGSVEGFNLKAKLTMRKAYGFRSPEHLQIALYHTLGDLPEPKTTHRFC